MEGHVGKRWCGWRARVKDQPTLIQASTTKKPMKITMLLSRAAVILCLQPPCEMCRLRHVQWKQHGRRGRSLSSLPRHSTLGVTPEMEASQQEIDEKSHCSTGKGLAILSVFRFSFIGGGANVKEAAYKLAAVQCVQHDKPSFQGSTTWRFTPRWTTMQAVHPTKPSLTNCAWTRSVIEARLNNAGSTMKER